MILRAALAVYFSALGLWVGGLAVLGAVVAPTVFGTAGSRPLAGRIFGSILRTFGWAELALGGLVVLSAWILRSTPKGRAAKLRLLLAFVMAVLAIVYVCGVNPTVHQRGEKLALNPSTPEDDPSRAQFRTLHRISESLVAANLLIGLSLLVFSAATLKPADGA
jgi:uncharacterized membrane protein